MTATHRTLRLLLLGATATAVLTPYAADSVVCADAAAGNLLATSWLDTSLNPPVGEDLEFLYKDAGLPNIMMLVDTSMSMQMLPPDGPGKIGGASSTQPPGYALSNPTNSAAQAAAAAATVAAGRVVGCGLDAVSQTTPGWLDSQTIQGIMQRVFYSPCGLANDSWLIGQKYMGHPGYGGYDYAAEMTVCPQYTPSDSLATGNPGFDPDFYDPDPVAVTSGGGKPNLFGRDLVFHDSALRGAYTYSSTLPFRGNFGDGWTDTDVYPFKRATNAVGSIADFCALQGTALQGTRTRQDICNECLTRSGWYYDGIILDPSDSSYAGRHPSLWYTGNYLNFFPPKFVVARKVMKDIIAVQSRIRMAMARFDSTGAAFIQPFNPTCGMPDGSNFDSNRSSYVSALNSSSTLPFDGATPLSRALFDVGRYYHSPALPWFGAAWENSTKESASNANQYAICYSCQVSSVIVLTDGEPSANDGNTLPPLATTAAQAASNLYAGAITTGILGITPATGCKECGAFSGTEDYLNNLPRVAWYLQNMDLRNNSESTLDCKKNGGKQSIQTYTVGFATGQNPRANKILRNTASAGGGIFVPAENPVELKKGIDDIIREISTRSTSFSVATISTLQTTAGRAVIVPRFDPNKTARWPGHLYRFDLYSEFVNDCTPYGAGDLDCDGTCEGTFLQDNSGTDGNVSLIAEDGNGSFMRNDPVDEPLCTQAPGCVAAGNSCADIGSAAAVPFWDAGEKLKAKRWQDRRIFTAVDSNGDGKIDGSDGTFLVEPTDAAAFKIAPYLALGTAYGTSPCTSLASALTDAGDLPSAVRVSTSKLECTKSIIRYVMGADLFNEGGMTTGWPPASQDLLPDRSFKLQDIFHSSPVVVDPPYPRTGIMCEAGLTTQCLKGLWATPTENGKEGYDEFSLHPDLVNRDKIILVGANDGLLHAFHAGTWRPGLDDTYTSKVLESLPPFNGHYDRGTADELWAFLPPDLISKLPLLMESEHQFFVDGTAWVRDVWGDGWDNGLPGLPAPSEDDVKEGREFHTVAVVGERRGGTRFFALDVTTATEAGSAPKLLWIYPQPDDRETTSFGETFNETLPMGPPILPVRIEASAGDTRTGVTPVKTYSDGTTTHTVPYHERWLVFLNGGFDPQYLRGRGIHAVDVRTGQEVFDFSHPGPVATGTPRDELKYPVAGPVGGMAWGSLAVQQQQAAQDHEYFFDTATFGDTGGQLWVVRFYAPGKLGADGRVTNWYGARVFQMQKDGAGTCTFCAGYPFFYVTNNIRLAERTYRVASGTGDRFNLLDKYGGTCGPDNLRACAMRGGSVSSQDWYYVPNQPYFYRYLSQYQCDDLYHYRWDDVPYEYCYVQGGSYAYAYDSTDGTSTYKYRYAYCWQGPDGWACNQSVIYPGEQLDIPDSLRPVTKGNWFTSLLVFEESGARNVFWDQAGANAYDTARTWIRQTAKDTFTATNGLVVRAANDDTLGTPATGTGKGWAVRYNNGPTETIGTVVYSIDWRDERTSSVAATNGPVMTWHTTVPATAANEAVVGGCRVSKCTEQNRRVSYHYGADPTTGQPVFRDSAGNLVRAFTSNLLVPPQGDQRTVFIDQQGRVSVGLTAVSPERGATNVGMTDPVDPTADVGFLEVDEELHDCRHAEGSPTCK